MHKNILKNLIYLTILFVLTIQSPLLSAINAGILPYALHNGKAYILLGEDEKRPNLWTDFGGEPKQEETAEQTAIREFKEETGNWVELPKITSNTPVITNISKDSKPLYQMYVVKINYFDPEQLRTHIKQNKDFLTEPEKIDFVWILLQDLMESVKKSTPEEKILLNVAIGSKRTKEKTAIILYPPFVKTVRQGIEILKTTAK